MMALDKVDWTLQIQATVLIILIDYFYLNIDFVRDMYAPIRTLHKQVKVPYAVASWAFIVLAIQLLVLTVPHSRWQDVFEHGAMLGFAMYGLYNLVNLATIDAWDARMALNDTIWGTLLVGGMSVVMASMRRP